jgi:hypothetical protein
MPRAAPNGPRQREITTPVQSLAAHSSAMRGKATVSIGTKFNTA